MKRNAFKNGYGIVCQNEKHARLCEFLKTCKAKFYHRKPRQAIETGRHLKCDLKYQISNKYLATVSFLTQKNGH